MNITKLEKLSVFINIPIFREIVGWRVIEVACDLMGSGNPSNILDMFKTKPIIKWYTPKTKFICEGCAHRLATMGRQAELEEYLIFS